MGDDSADFPLMATWRRAQEVADEIDLQIAKDAPAYIRLTAQDRGLVVNALRFYAEKAREQTNG